LRVKINNKVKSYMWADASYFASWLLARGWAGW
jgi:hypothetical protein